MIDCTMCGGSGEVHTVGTSINPRTGTPVRDPQTQRDYECPRCHGTGAEPLDEHKMSECIAAAVGDRWPESPQWIRDETARAALARYRR